MIHHIKVERTAYCTLEATIAIDADSREEAEQMARQVSEAGNAEFTVKELDLACVEGSSEVIQ